MPRTRLPYPAAFRDQMVELVRAGRSPEALAKEFEPSAVSIRGWATQADRNAGRRLGVSASGYHAWHRRGASARMQRDQHLLEQIRASHRQSRGTYGAPRVRPAPDLVQRMFTATGPNQLWVADITSIPTGSGTLYLAVMLDVWSRRIIGWAMATHRRTSLVLAALDMAIAQRRPTAVIHHSDQGCQSTAIEFGRRCRDAHVRPSMGSVGDCYDNAMCESFFATLECELLERVTLRTPAPFLARLRVADGLRAGGGDANASHPTDGDGGRGVTLWPVEAAGPSS